VLWRHRNHRCIIIIIIIIINAVTCDAARCLNRTDMLFWTTDVSLSISCHYVPSNCFYGVTVSAGTRRQTQISYNVLI